MPSAEVSRVRAGSVPAAEHNTLRPARERSAARHASAAAIMEAMVTQGSHSNIWACAQLEVVVM
jgi:hypothetical protein